MVLLYVKPRTEKDTFLFFEYSLQHCSLLFLRQLQPLLNYQVIPPVEGLLCDGSVTIVVHSVLVPLEF